MATLSSLQPIEISKVTLTAVLVFLNNTCAVLQHCIRTFGIYQSFTWTKIRRGQLFLYLGHIFWMQDIEPTLTQQVTLCAKKILKYVKYIIWEERYEMYKNSFRGNYLYFRFFFLDENFITKAIKNWIPENSWVSVKQTRIRKGFFHDHSPPRRQNPPQPGNRRRHLRLCNLDQILITIMQWQNNRGKSIYIFIDNHIFNFLGVGEI